MLEIGTKVRVNETGWKRYEAENGKSRPINSDYPQKIIEAPNNPPFENCFMLSFPLFWFHENELEEVNKEMTPENLALTCDLGVDNKIDYVSRKIREVLGTQHIGENQSRDIVEKKFNRDREYMRILYENILKKKCADMGIDPESLRVDWESGKWGDEK